MGRKRTLVEEARGKLDEARTRALSLVEVRELDTLIKIQLHGVDVIQHELYSFGNMDIPLQDGTILRLFSNKPRALYLKGTHAYHAHLVSAETGETLHSVAITKKPDEDARLSEFSTKVDSRKILTILRKLTGQYAQKRPTTR